MLILGPMWKREETSPSDLSSWSQLNLSSFAQEYRLVLLDIGWLVSEGLQLPFQLLNFSLSCKTPEFLLVTDNNKQSLIIIKCCSLLHSKTDISLLRFLPSRSCISNSPWSEFMLRCHFLKALDEGTAEDCVGAGTTLSHLLNGILLDEHSE